MVALPGFLSKLFDANARDIAKYQSVVAKINALEPQMEELTDEQIREKTEELRKRVQDEYNKQRDAAEPTWAGLTDQQRREADRKSTIPFSTAFCRKRSRWCARPPSARSACATTMCR